MARVEINFERLQSVMDDAISEGMNVALVGMGRLVRGSLSRPGLGRIYRVAKGRKTGKTLRARGYHRASAPGQPPAVNTNRLRASWSVGNIAQGNYSTGDGFAFKYREGKTVVLQYGSNVPYARLLEYGTRRMKPRPYLKPSLASAGKRIGAIFRVAIKKAMDRK